MPVAFPALRPSSRTYTPGNYPKTEFQANNGARVTLAYGSRPVDAELALSFQNISDDDAAQILANYQAVNGTWDYVTFSGSNGLAGMTASLQAYAAEGDGGKLRYRYSGPPQVTSVQPGISSVTCKFIAYLDGA